MAHFSEGHNAPFFVEISRSGQQVLEKRRFEKHPDGENENADSNGRQHVCAFQGLVKTPRLEQEEHDGADDGAEGVERGVGDEVQ